MQFYIMACQEIRCHDVKGRQERMPAAEGPEAGYAERRIFIMNETTKYQLMKNRELLKGYHAGDAGAEETDQQQKLPSISPMKEKIGKGTISLPKDFQELTVQGNLLELIVERKSRRQYQEKPLTLLELSYLLWATQGVRNMAGHKNPVTFRNVPSAGSRHPFETYLFISRVEGLEKGIYHYLPEKHELELWEDKKDYETELTQALCGQYFAASAPVVFVWSALPYRTEWRYGQKAAKYILLDAGHVCENLYLACQSIGCGTCAIGAYDQDCLDELLGFEPGPSGEKDYECAVYAAPVGKRKEEL